MDNDRKRLSDRQIRLKEIRELVAEKGIDNISITKLSEMYSVSKSQISQDLKYLLKDIDEDQRQDVKRIIIGLRDKHREIQNKLYELTKSRNDNVSVKASKYWLDASRNFLSDLKKLGYRFDDDDSVSADKNTVKYELVTTEVGLSNFLNFLKAKKLENVDVNALFSEFIEGSYTCKSLEDRIPFREFRKLLEIPEPVSDSVSKKVDEKEEPVDDLGPVVDDVSPEEEKELLALDNPFKRKGKPKGEIQVC